LITRCREYWKSDGWLSLLLAMVVLQLFAVVPMGTLPFSGFIPVVTFYLVLFSGVLATARTRMSMAVESGIVLASALAYVAHARLGDEWLWFASTGLGVLSLMILVFVILRSVLRPGRITLHRILGAIAAYVIVGLAFAEVYAIISMWVPDAFSMSEVARLRSAHEFVYFSMVTLSTLGYGDITAAHPLARSFAMLEALIGQLYPTILIAWLVGMHMSDAAKQKRASQ
jgi:hypothetical protein